MTSPSDVSEVAGNAITGNGNTEDGAIEDGATDERAVEDVLGRLIERGYRFVHPRDDTGEIVTIVGVRAHGAVVDVVRLDAEDEVSASRMPVDEPDILAPRTVLWNREGEMCEVVDALLTLPDVPDETFAPRRPGAARGCWVPGNRGRAKWLAAAP